MPSRCPSGSLSGRNLTFVVMTLAVSIITDLAHSQGAPESIPFQGFVTNAGGDPISSTVDITTTFYKNGVAGYAQVHPNVGIVDGVFNVTIGPVDTVVFDQPIDLGIQLGADPEISPRTPLQSVPFALGMRGIYTVWVDDGTYEGFNVIGGAPNNSVAAGVVGATIGGGGGILFSNPRLNTVTGDWGTVGGGSGNTASGFSSTGGGFNNMAAGNGSTVGGGQSNTAAGFNSTVGGGISNTAGGSTSTVGGGSGNTAGGSHATVPGGTENRAVGYASFATGYHAKAVHEGTFVWNDRSITTQNDSLVSTGDNQFLIRAAGGVAIGTNSPNRELTIFDGDNDGDAVLNLKASNAAARELLVGVNQSTGGLISMETDNNLQFRTNGTARITIEGGGEVGIGTVSPAHPLHMASGAHVTAGGIWTSVSSRELKQGFEAVEGRDVLDAVASLPVTRWRYKNEEGAVHMGPVAEDFYAAFGLGADDKHIASLDGNGVALAAIQGLYEMLMAQQAEIEDLRRRLAE